ncbi:MAG TPA: superoxide dismutase family protein [Thermoanaerobaculia bacterium]|jgi:Cu-Zn family superoxide dismutase|nr:superoxide dismutase family protein [Thermoanaerobaculia bacterium]
MKKIAALSFSLLLLGACASMSSGPSATATLAPTSGSTAAGTVTLTQLGDGSVRVEVKLTGVPAGVHGFHIHEKGDCGDNGNAAGGHYNPMTTPHGAPEADPHHAGDFGNVTADGSGNVRTTFTTRSITVEEGHMTAVGHAVILHANPDDLTTQPSGNAGPRIACGIVTRR